MGLRVASFTSLGSDELGTERLTLLAQLAVYLINASAVFSPPMAQIIVGTLFLFFITLTLLPLSRHKVWWVRGADFPRLQLVAVGVAVLAASVALLDTEKGVVRAMMVATVVGVAYQSWWILPYTFLHTPEVKGATPPLADDRLRILSANILMTNERHEDVVALIRQEQPDVVILLETNAQWARALAVVKEELPHVLACPLENLYGMHLYSRFPIEDPKIQFLVEKEVPSFHLLLILPSQRRVELHCLHPAPPSPTENESSNERDAELIMVGRAVADSDYAMVVTGDLNDVAWSPTTRLFRKISGLLDPRVGRGLFNTFSARCALMRWPVDHFFISREFTLIGLKRLAACGSDHFPVLIDLALTPAEAHTQQGLTPDAEDHADARAHMAKEGVSESEVHLPKTTSGRT